MTTAQRLQTDESLSCTQILDVLAPAFKDSSIDVGWSASAAPALASRPATSSPTRRPQPRTVLLELEDEPWHVSDPDPGG